MRECAQGVELRYTLKQCNTFGCSIDVYLLQEVTLFVLMLFYYLLSGWVAPSFSAVPWLA
jgi:hypothetical protein